ncbi:MAG TPA: SH3 domain-containing protein [Hyphomonadaceae bacterium]|nr:SH3 domain-containing protein [Hyphomonadaceae bacterium]HPI47046.1 SH3 domain-containing protein [Hyphomonadaceae bacterium]
MRVVVSAVFVAALAASGVAVAQIPGQPAIARASYTVEPFAPAGAPITIQGTGVRLRSEPFTTPQTQVLSSGSTGLILNVVGIARLADWNWYQVVLKNGQKAFIRSDLTSAPSRGSGQPAPAMPAAPEIAYTPTPPPTPPAYVPPAYTPPVPIEPQTVPLAPAVTQPTNSDRPSLDLPRPSDPAGLQSH